MKIELDANEIGTAIGEYIERRRMFPGGAELQIAIELHSSVKEGKDVFWAEVIVPSLGMPAKCHAT